MYIYIIFKVVRATEISIFLTSHEFYGVSFLNN